MFVIFIFQLDTKYLEPIEASSIGKIDRYENSNNTSLLKEVG